MSQPHEIRQAKHLADILEPLPAEDVKKYIREYLIESDHVDFEGVEGEARKAVDDLFHDMILFVVNQ